MDPEGIQAASGRGDFQSNLPLFLSFSPFQDSDEEPHKTEREG